MIKKLLLFISCFLHVHALFSLNVINKEDAAALLKIMVEQDQKVRKKALTLAQRSSRPIADVMHEFNIQEINKQHVSLLKEIVNCHGWPRLSEFGQASCDAAWVLIQHAQDIDFQKECLKLMQCLPEGEVAKKWIAYLYDRIQINQNLPQYYGTQINSEVQDLFEIEDPDTVDKRRFAMGLEPLAEYIKFHKKCMAKYS